MGNAYREHLMLVQYKKEVKLAESYLCWIVDLEPLDKLSSVKHTGASHCSTNDSSPRLKHRAPSSDGNQATENATANREQLPSLGSPIGEERVGHSSSSSSKCRTDCSPSYNRCLNLILHLKVASAVEAEPRKPEEEGA